MTRNEWLAANQNAAVEEILGRNNPSPMWRFRFVGTASDATDFADVIASSLVHHATRRAVQLVGSTIVQDDVGHFSCYVLTSSRKVIVPAADLITAATTFSDLVAEYGNEAVIAKILELHNRDTLAEWRAYQNGLTPLPPHKYARKAHDLTGVLYLTGIELAGLAVWG